MSSCLAEQYFTKARLPRWPQVKVRHWSLLSPFSSMHLLAMVFMSLPSMTIWLSVTLNGWGRSICSMVCLLTALTSTSPTPPNAARHIRPTSLLVLTMSSVSTICATIWPFHHKTLCNVPTIMLSSTRLTQY